MNLLIQALIDFILKVVAKTTLKQAIVVAALIAFTSMVTTAFSTYITAYTSLVAGLNQTMPQVVSGVWGWIMPPNLHLCILTMVSAVALRFTTRLMFYVITTKFQLGLSK